MFSFARLFAKGPFSSLQAHMHKVQACMAKLQEIFDLFFQGRHDEIEAKVLLLSDEEHAADIIKNEIRNSLSKAYFLSVDRAQILDIISLQDALADQAEDVAQFLVMRRLKIPPSLEKVFQDSINKNIDAFWDVVKIINKLDALVEASFGGVEAEKVRTLANQIAFKEHEADVLKGAFLKELFNIADDLSTAEFYLWNYHIDHINRISHLSEKLAMRIDTLVTINS